MDLPFNPFVCSEANGIKRARQQEANGAPEIPDTDKPKSKKPKSKATPSGSKDGEASFKGYSPEKTMDSMDTHSDLPMVV